MNLFSQNEYVKMGTFIFLEQTSPCSELEMAIGCADTHTHVHTHTSPPPPPSHPPRTVSNRFDRISRAAVSAQATFPLLSPEVVSPAPCPLQVQRVNASGLPRAVLQTDSNGRTSIYGSPLPGGLLYPSHTQIGSKLGLTKQPKHHKL